MFEDISKEVIDTIKTIIEERDQCVLDIQKSFQTYWMRDSSKIWNPETEFRISRLGNLQLLISRVRFKNRRCGTMAAILQILKEYCIEEKIERIRVQSVETYEMMQFCLKHEMKPNIDNIWVGDVLLGDYDLMIEQVKEK